MEDLINIYSKITGHIYFIPTFLPLDEKQYQEEVLDTIMLFITTKGEVRKITLEVLEKDFPEYHEYAQEYIKYLEQQEPE